MTIRSSFLWFSCALLSACVSPSTLAIQGSSLVSGASGEVQLEQVEGGSWMVSVALEQLPAPERIGGQHRYVVWALLEGEVIASETVRYVEEHRAGRSMLVAPERPDRLIVSAERSEHESVPSEFLLFDDALTEAAER